MRLVAFAALFLIAAGQAQAQELRGRVVRAGLGVAGVSVELHRVARDTSGVMARSTTDGEGEFQFQTPSPSDTGFAVVFATADWQGVRYFGQPLHPSASRGGYEVVVFDTAGLAGNSASVRLARRDLVLLPEAGNGWEVNEVLQIENAASQTLVSADGTPAFEFAIPDQATGFEAGDGGLGLLEVRRMGDRVLVLAPLRPGTHEMVVRYRIPRTETGFVVPNRTPTGELNVLVRQTGPEVQIEGMTGPRPEVLAGETFQRFSATGLAAGKTVRIEWRDPTRAPVSPVIAATAVAGLLLLGGTGAAIRNARGKAR